jgi:putative hydrolase of the HAD superfamily
MSEGRKSFPRIDAVIFDYGEVLCHPPRADEIVRMAAFFGVDAKKFPPLWQKNRGAYDRGDLTPTAYWTLLAQDAKVTITPQQLAELNELDAEMWGRENQLMVEWMKQIAAAGIKIGLLSNMHPEMVRYVRDKFAWIADFAPAVFSADVRMIKPDAEIYHHILEKLNVAPENAMFIDDREANIQAARALGIHAIHLRSLSQLRNDVEKLGFPVLPKFSTADDAVAAAIKM